MEVALACGFILPVCVYLNIVVQCYYYTKSFFRVYLLPLRAGSWCGIMSDVIYCNRVSLGFYKLPLRTGCHNRHHCVCSIQI